MLKFEQRSLLTNNDSLHVCYNFHFSCTCSFLVCQLRIYWHGLTHHNHTLEQGLVISLSKNYNKSWHEYWSYPKAWWPWQWAEEASHYWLMFYVWAQGRFRPGSFTSAPREREREREREMVIRMTSADLTTNVHATMTSAPVHFYWSCDLWHHMFTKEPQSLDFLQAQFCM